MVKQRLEERVRAETDGQWSARDEDVDKGKGRRVDETVVRWMIGGIMDS